jgi:hypothetical protein|tara:strand:+ start:234 stop:1451 length:1218 start_codon:yes stop_codon:yes gene_type:complete
MSIFAAPTFYNQADQNIYNQGFSFVPQERFRGGAFNFPTTPTTTGAATGIETVPINMGGGGGNSMFTGGVNNLITDYNTITKDRYFRNQDTPLVDDLYQSKLDKTFMGFPSYKQQELTGPDLGEYIGTNTDVPLELTRAGRIQEGLGSFKDKIGNVMGSISGFGPISMALNAMDRFDTLSPVDQQFINMNMGYTGPTVFGENRSGLSKDPYGINTRSAFGNYADYVENFNTDYTDEELANMSKFRRQKIQFYQQKQKELQEIREAEIQKQKEQAQSFMDKNPNYGDPEKNINPGSGGGKGYDPGADYSGSDKRSQDNRSSDLGFSDIRLKENIELIGKSPSNINIYRFNYISNPIKYQGVMAHEVPWASQKHGSGYLMVDYNKIDVDFKKDIDYSSKTLYKEDLD